MRTAEEILREAETIAVVGASPDPARPSYGVMAYLLRSGYRVLPVNPGAGGELLGQRCFGSLAEIEEPVDLVDVFRKASLLPDVARDAVLVGAKTFWAQLGLFSQEAADIAHRAGLAVVMNRCLKIEHARFAGGLHLAGFDTGVISARRPRRPGAL